MKKAKKALFWDAGDLRCEAALRKEISDNVQAAYKEIFKYGRLSLFATDGVMTFHFTDATFEFRKEFSVQQIQLCVEDEEGKDAAVRALEKLIELVKRV